MRRLILLIAALVAVLPVLVVSSAQAASPTGETVVSFTFDGTYKGQDAAAEILSAHDMAGTFYVNSGYLNFPAYLSVDQLRTIARNRSEVGGASLYGNDLSLFPRKRALAEVCDDRTTLAQLGFTVSSFSYPHATSTAEVKGVAQECGYNSGREVAGLYESAASCSSCPAGESIPPTDDFRIRTVGAGLSVAEMEKRIRRAEKEGGGWVPLVFTHVCVCPGTSDAISPTDFEALVTWVENRPATTSVKTIDQVMGGELKPVVGKPLDRLVPDPSAAIGTPQALSRVPAWTILGVGIGQAQILFIGVLLTIAVVATYRIASRGNRYAR